MSAPKPVSFLLILGIMLVIFLIVFDVHAQHECQGGHNCNDGEILDPQQQVKRSVGIGVSGSDMDINDCLATESWIFGLYQRTKPNYLCMADKAQARGELTRAAEFRCIYWGVRRAQGGKDECIERLTYDNPPALEVMVGQVPDTDEDDDDRYVQQQEEIEYLREESASLAGQLKQITRRLEQPPIQIDDGAERRAKSREAYEEALAKGSEQ